MKILFSTILFVVMISFTNSALALPPPNGNDTPIDNGKREKSDQDSHEKSVKKLKPKMHSSSNPSISLPHAPIIPTTFLSHFTFFSPIEVKPSALKKASPEKVKKKKTDSINISEDNNPTKRKKRSHHPLIKEISQVLNSFLNERALINFEQTIEEEVEKLIQRKKDKTKEIAYQNFQQSFKDLDLQIEFIPDGLETFFSFFKSIYKDEFDADQINSLQLTVNNILPQFVEKDRLDDCHEALLRYFTNLQKNLNPALEPSISLKSSNSHEQYYKPKEIELTTFSIIPELHAIDGILALMTKPALQNKTNLDQTNDVINAVSNEEELRNLVILLKRNCKNQKIVVQRILLNIMFVQGNEDTAFDDLIFLLEHIELDKLLMFSIENTFLGSLKAAKLFQFLKNATQLKILVLQNCNLRNDEVIYIADNALSNLKNLTHLSLGKNNCGSIALLYLMRALKNLQCLPNLEFLDISENNAGKKALIGLLSILPHMRKLKTLIIGLNKIKTDDMVALLRKLETSPCLSHLERLSLAKNEFDKIAILELARIIPAMTSLKELSITDNNCGSIDTLILAKALTQLHKIEKIWLQNIHVDEERIKRSLAYFTRIQSLKEIVLKTKFENEITNNLIKFLKVNFPHMLNILRIGN